eukprot:8094817-Prorocentrum_lima.AAC.1
MPRVAICEYGSAPQMIFFLLRTLASWKAILTTFSWASIVVFLLAWALKGACNVGFKWDRPPSWMTTMS